MKKVVALLTLALALAPALQPQTPAQSACVTRCMTEPEFQNVELQRQEIIILEKEAARSIQLSNGTFFRRVYSDDFAGTLSHGQSVNKSSFIEAVQSPDIKYESFVTSDIKVRVFRDTAIATCMWSARSIARGQRFSSQMRAVHVYLNGPGGWRVIAGQATLLPPGAQQPL
jgi:ketosteroid isomerase-like protein